MKQNKKKDITLWILYGVLMVATILIFVFSAQIYGVKKGIDDAGAIIWDPRSVFDKTVSENAFAQYMYQNAIPNTLHTIQIIGVAVTLGILLHYLAKITFHNKKSLTIAKLIANFLKWVIAIASVFFVMDAWGADTTTMIASAGVVTLIIGLGSQALVADILANPEKLFAECYDCAGGERYADDATHQPLYGVALLRQRDADGIAGY